MSRETVWQSSFNAGELSPLILGQFNLERYKNGCKRIENATPLIQGPLQKRNGSKYVAATKNVGSFWYWEFYKNRFDTYVLEFGTKLHPLLSQSRARTAHWHPLRGCDAVDLCEPDKPRRHLRAGESLNPMTCFTSPWPVSPRKR